MLKKQNAIKSLLVCFCLLYAVFSFGQSDPTGERRVTGTYAITQTTVYPSPGNVITDATLIIRNGLIEAVGKGISIPADAQIIPGDSLMVYPGFIDVAGIAGICLPPEAEKPDNLDPSDPPYEVAGITPYRNALDYWDVKSHEVKKWRKSGFTLSQVLPKGEMLPGKAALVYFGPDDSNNILMENTGLFAHFDSPRAAYPATTLGVMATWRNLYQNAILSKRHQTLFASNSLGIQRPSKDKVLEAFYPVIDKSIPVLFKVTNHLEINRALRLQKELDFKLVLLGIKNNVSSLQEIKASQAQVVLSLELPRKDAAEKEFESQTEASLQSQKRVQESYKEALGLAGRLEEASIPFAFGTKGADHGDFMKNLRLMISQGLSEEAALTALTTNAAKIIGMEEVTGTIEKGKWANLVITSDSLFKKTSTIQYVMVDGYLFDYKDSKNDGHKSFKKDLEGEWSYTSSTPGGSSKGKLKFKKKEDGWKGTITIDDPEGSGQIDKELEEIEVGEGYLKFVFHVTVKGMELTVKTKGDLSRNLFEGKMYIKDHGNYPFRATKEPDANFKD